MVLFGVDILPVDQAMCRRIVQFVVENGSASVLDGVLDGSDDDNDNQRYGAETGVGGTEDGEDLGRVLRWGIHRLTSRRKN